MTGQNLPYKRVAGMGVPRLVRSSKRGLWGIIRQTWEGNEIIKWPSNVRRRLFRSCASSSAVGYGGDQCTPSFASVGSSSRVGAIPASEAKHIRSWRTSSSRFFHLFSSTPSTSTNGAGISLTRIFIRNIPRYKHPLSDPTTTPSLSTMSAMERAKSESEVSMKDVEDELDEYEEVKPRRLR